MDSHMAEESKVYPFLLVPPLNVVLFGEALLAFGVA